MAVNRGKQFEKIIYIGFKNITDVSIDRLHDQTTGYKGSTNICDFIVYKKPHEIYLECKTVHGNAFPFNNITETQWQGLLEKSHIKGVVAGVLCWWVEKDITRFIPIQVLQMLKEEQGRKSLNCYWDSCIDVYGNRYYMPEIEGKKKRVFFEYDLNKFLKDIEVTK